MLEQNTQSVPETDVQNPSDLLNPEWGNDAPRGGKTVLNHIIKEKATVPLFFGQTLISSLRDVGYNSTTSALCEHVDNAIQWGATELRVYFRQTGKKASMRPMCWYSTMEKEWRRISFALQRRSAAP